MRAHLLGLGVQFMLFHQFGHDQPQAHATLGLFAEQVR